MMRTPFQLLPGLTAFDAQTASHFFGAATDHGGLSAALQQLQAGLEGRGDNPVLEDLYTAVRGYREAVASNRPDLIAVFQRDLAQTVARVSNNIWRERTQGYFDSGLSSLYQNAAYLADTLMSLRRVAGSRAYTIETPSEDKIFLRTVIGGLTLFLQGIDAQPAHVVAGMVEEVGTQLQDAALRSLLEKTGVTEPTRRPPEPSAPRTSETPAPVSALPAPAKVPETIEDAPTATSEPPSTAAVLLPFAYHPDSGEELDRSAEFILQKVVRKLENERVGWPYDFIAWVRTLYKLSEDLPNGHGTRARYNLTRGLTRLNDMTTLSVADIRRILGPVSIAVGRPLEGLPSDWPQFMPNDVATSLVVIHDRGLTSQKECYGRIASAAALLWAASGGLPNESALRGDLKTLVRGLERTLLNSEAIAPQAAFRKLRKILEAMEESKRPAIDLSDDSAQPESRDSEIPQSSRTMPAAEWVKRAWGFLAHERRIFADPGDTRPIAEMTRRVEETLAHENPALPNAARLLNLLFQLTITYRHLSGVSGEAALALGRESHSPLTVEDLSSALETLSGRSNPRPEILQDLAEEKSADPKGYASLLGPEGLTELVGRYAEYLRQEKPEALRLAAVDFVENHPDLGLDLSMTVSVLAYFNGLLERPFDAPLLKQVTEGLDIAPSATIDVADFAEAEPNEPLFQDLNQDKLTPYGMVFFKVLYDRRPKIAYRAQRFMIYMERLSRIYGAYWKTALEEGRASFDAAFDKAFEKSTYARDEEKKQKFQFYRQQYRGLFDDLFQFLARNPGLAEMVHLCLLQGETQLSLEPRREGLHIAGGTPVPAKTESEALAEAATEDLEETVDATPEPVAAAEKPRTEPRPSRVDEELYSVPDDVRASGTETGANPFVFDHGSDDLDLFSDTQASASETAAVSEVPPPPPVADVPIPAAPAPAFAEELEQILSYWKALGSGPNVLRLGRQHGRHVHTVDRTSGRKPMVLVRPAVTPSEAELKESAASSDGISLLRENRGDTLDIGANGDKAVGDFGMIRRIVKAKGAVESGQRKGVSLMVEARFVTPRARRFFFSIHPEGRILVRFNGTYSLFSAEAGPAGLSEVRKEFSREGTLTAFDRAPLAAQPDDLPYQETGRGDLHPETSAALRKFLSSEDLQDSLWVALKTIGFLDPKNPQAADILKRAEAAGKATGTPAAADAKRLLDSALTEIYARFKETAPVAPARPKPQPAPAPKPVEEPAAEAPVSILAPELEAATFGWNLDHEHRKIVAEMAAASSVQKTLDILRVIASGNDNAGQKRAWLEAYQQAVANKRLTPRGKARILELLSHQETFGQVAPLLRVISIKALDLVLDRILPDPPLQLGRRFGRFVLTHDADNNKVPRIITRPAVNADEGYCEEKAVTADRASLLMWTHRRVLDIGIQNGRIVGPFHVIRMIIKSAGATASGKRTNVHLLIMGDGVTPRTRRFFFEQHPKGTLIVRGRGRVTVYRQHEAQGQHAEEIRQYSAGGALENVTRQVLPSAEGSLPVKHIQETDWNAETHRAITQGLKQAIARRERAGQMGAGARLKEVRDQAIRAVGFLKPDHPDAAAILAICGQFPTVASQHHILELQEALERTTRNILSRFEDMPAPLVVEQPAATAAMPVPAAEDASNTDTALVEEEEAAPAERADVPWTEAIRNFLYQVCPKDIRKDIDPKKASTASIFMTQAFKKMRDKHRAELYANLRDAILAVANRALRRRLLAEFEPGGRMAQITVKGGNMISRSDLREVVLFAARATGGLVEPAPNSNPPEVPSTPPPSAAPKSALSDLLQWAERISQITSSLVTLPGFGLLRIEIERLLSENPETAALARRLNGIGARDFPETFRAVAAREEAAAVLNGIDDGWRSLAVVQADLLYGAFRDEERYFADLEKTVRFLDVRLKSLKTDGSDETTVLAVKLEAEGYAALCSEFLEQPVLEALDKLSEEAVDLFNGMAGRFQAAAEAADFRLLELEEAAASVWAGEGGKNAGGRQEAKLAQDIADANEILRNKQSGISSLLSELRAAFAELDSATGETLTAEIYSKLCASIAQRDEIVSQRIDDLQETTERYRLQWKLVSSSSDELAEVWKAWEKLAAETQRLVGEAADTLVAPIQKLQALENSLPVAAPVERPEVPTPAGRSFQIDPGTSREILRVLADVPQALYETANSYPELAILAPDEDVYDRLFRILRCRQRYGAKGAYMEILTEDGIKPAYAAGGLIQRFRSTVSVVIAAADGTSVTREFPKSAVRNMIDLSSVDPAAFEKDIRNPEAYHRHKFEHMIAVSSLPEENVQEFRKAFLADWVGRREDTRDPRLGHLRIALLDDPQLTAVVCKTIRERLPLAEVLEKTREFIDHLHIKPRPGQNQGDFKAHMAALNRAQTEELLLTNFFINVRGVYPELNMGVAAAEAKLAGIVPMGRYAADLASVGWIRRVAVDWASGSGKTDPRAWTARLARARVFSTPESSHLLFSPEKIRAAEDFLRTRAPVRTKLTDDLGRREIRLVRQGRGYRLLPAAEAPEGNWYRTFLTRLNLLTDRSSPVLDVLAALLDEKENLPEALWRQVAGIVMEIPEEKPVSADEIRNRLAVWIQADRAKLSCYRQLRSLLTDGASAEEPEDVAMPLTN